MGNENEFLKLRREILDDEFGYLNKEQRAGVFNCDAPLLILAGAGSGKTTVVVSKIGYLMKYGNSYFSNRVPENLEKDDIVFLKKALKDKSLREGDRFYSLMADSPVKPYNILAITFTNKAAGEMRERIESRYGIDTRTLWAQTFHSTCVKILRAFISKIGYESSFSIYDDSDSVKLLDGIIKKLNLPEKYNAKIAASFISKAKCAYQTPEEFEKDFNEPIFSYMPKIYKMYQKELKASNALDFDDLIFCTVKLLSECPDVAEKINRRFKYVLVDEYQDTNPLQYRLVSLLSKGGKICVVGDDDQSIYRFMGAHVGNILNFERDFPGAKVVRLEQNYRSTQPILSAANAVIANNTKRKGKNLWTDRKDGDKIVFHTFYNQQEEGNFICKTILDGLYQGKKYSDFCVLYRARSQSHSIEMALKGNGIPYKVFGGQAFFKRKEVQDMMAYLNVVNNPYDETRLRRIINEPKRGIGDTTIDKITSVSLRENIPMYSVMLNAANYPELSSSADKVNAFCSKIEDFRACGESMSISELFEYMYLNIGYDDMLRKNFVQSEYQSRRENVLELLSSIRQFEEENDSPTLMGYLEQSALISSVDDMEENPEYVTLMTMHCAKGLEFDTVFISGFEEGLFPSERSAMEDGGIEEERRLCYVAITRAKRKLYITSTKNRLLYGRIMNNIPSRFLDEIPDDFIEKHLVSADMRRYEEFEKERHEKSSRQKKAFSIMNGSFGRSNVDLAAKPSVKFKPGQRVYHKVFGDGTVVSVVNMSSDSMLEVAFDKVGTKKLMSNYAKLDIKE